MLAGETNRVGAAGVQRTAGHLEVVLLHLCLDTPEIVADEVAAAAPSYLPCIGALSS